ncbi:alpha/beta-hydrolase family protein [Janibacter corallicola]|uniref:alpha/beta-hydrolase family protein n=1 Tax=Janibacter corallicola TaxID=415212 RepID=UPI000834B921|nr:alpha/beta-hydrolase family protein [Janibacter corallicola]
MTAVSAPDHDLLPRVSSSLAAVIGLYLSISPTALPHGAVLQGVVSACFVTMCVQASLVIRRNSPPSRGAARVVGLVGVALLATAVGLWGDQVLDAARAGAGMAPLGWRYWAAVLGVVAAALLLRHAAERAWRGPARSRRVWRPVLVAVVCIGLVLAGGPAHGIEPDGRMWVMQHPSPVGAVRAYARMVPGESAGARAERATRHLVDEGGLQRSRVVVVLPTGSGWVDPQFLSGIEHRFGRDVATVSMQYDASPSWWSWLVHRERSAESARLLFDAVAKRVRALPPRERPDLHVYGESLGAEAGQAILTGADRARARAEVCSVLWVGPPGGHRVGLRRETVVANPDDPVVHASWRDALRPPPDATRWLPLVGGVHDLVDFAGSLRVPEGTGHRYGTDQVARLRTCPGG